MSIGILRTSFKKFLLFDAFCATAVVSFFFGLSYLFGENVKTWIRDSEKVVTGVVAGAVLIALVVFWLRRRRQRAAAAVQSPPELEPTPSPATHPPAAPPPAAESPARAAFGKGVEHGNGTAENGSAATRRIVESAAGDRTSRQVREE